MKNRPNGIFYPGDLVRIKEGIPVYARIEYRIDDGSRKSARGKLTLAQPKQNPVCVPHAFIGYNPGPKDTCATVVSVVTGKAQRGQSKLTERLHMWLYIIYPGLRGWINARGAKLVNK